MKPKIHSSFFIILKNFGFKRTTAFFYTQEFTKKENAQDL